jgi:hypothetical protein
MLLDPQARRNHAQEIGLGTCGCSQDPINAPIILDWRRIRTAPLALLRSLRLLHSMRRHFKKKRVGSTLTLNSYPEPFIPTGVKAKGCQQGVEPDRSRHSRD